MGQKKADTGCRRFFAENEVCLTLRKDPFMFGVFYDYIKEADPSLWMVIYSNLYSVQQASPAKDFNLNGGTASSITHSMRLLDAAESRCKVIEQAYADNGDTVYLIRRNGQEDYLHCACFTGQDPFLRCGLMYMDCIEMPLMLLRLLCRHIIGCTSGNPSIEERQRLFLTGTAHIFMKDEATVEKLINTGLSVPSQRKLIRDAVLGGAESAGPEDAARLIQTADRCLSGLHMMTRSQRYAFYIQTVRMVFPNITGY